MSPCMRPRHDDGHLVGQGGMRCRNACDADMQQEKWALCVAAHGIGSMRNDRQSIITFGTNLWPVQKLKDKQYGSKSAIALTINPVFHGKIKHIRKRYHFIRECVENGKLEDECVQGDKQKADILTKALGQIRFKEMRGYIGMKNIEMKNFKFKRENVRLSLKIV
ncbi:hypothetical protein Bca4012_006143 [Brassica carinata]